MLSASSGGDRDGGKPSNKSLLTLMKPLDVSTGSEAWKRWKERFEIYLCATNLQSEDDKRKNSLLLQVIGDEAFAVYQSFNVSYNAITHEDLVKKFDDHFFPETNVDMAIYKLITRKQKDGESIEDFVTDLMNLSHACELDNHREKMVKSVMIAGLNSKHEKIRVRLLKEKNQSLTEAVKLALQLIDACKENLREIETSSFNGNAHKALSSSSSQNLIRCPLSSQFHSGEVTQSHSGGSIPKEPSDGQRRKTGGNSRNCPNCGNYRHYSGRCPALGRKCDECGILNHFAAVCRKTQECKRMTSLKCDNPISPDFRYSIEEDESELFVSAKNSIDDDDEEHWKAVEDSFDPNIEAAQPSFSASSHAGPSNLNGPHSEMTEYERLQSLLEEKIVYTTKRFNCDSCNLAGTKYGQGVILKECAHTFCRYCIKTHFQINSDKDLITCLHRDCKFPVYESEIQALLTEEEYNIREEILLKNFKNSTGDIKPCRMEGCPSFVEVGKGVQEFLCEVCNSLNCLNCNTIHWDGNSCQRSYERKLHSFEDWLSLNDDPIIANTEPFDCIICYGTYGIGEGIVLKNCLHYFCRNCLQALIENSENVEVRCPHIDGDTNCESVLQIAEIRMLLPPDNYDKFLIKSIKLAESQMEDVVHCLSPDCEFFCTLEGTNFHCPLCNELNCTICKAVHTNKTCQQHMEDLLEKSDPEKQADIQASEEEIRSLIRQGNAMVCPRCGAYLQKISGCNAVSCRCNARIDWGTKTLQR